jgi:kynurenine formamidase
VDEAEVLALFERCSNAGRWGPDDERGTLNHISAAKRVEAAKLVREGRVVALGRDLDTRPSLSNPTPMVHRMLFSRHEGAVSAFDSVEIAPHGFRVTHLDAIGHVFFEGRAYNGRLADDILTPQGMTFGSIHGLREGFFTRGILLDVAASRGVEWLAPGEGVSVEDLERAEKLARVEVGAGDAIIVRVGLGAREAALGEEDPRVRAGLLAECIPWIFDRRVAVYGGDCVEAIPAPYERPWMPLHMVGMVAMGLVMLDNPEVEELATAAGELGRRDFLLTCAPLSIPGGTGSAVNPLAIF